MSIQNAVAGLVVTGLALSAILSWCYSQVRRVDRIAKATEKRLAKERSPDG